jgi:hypothetical protein
MAEFLGLGAVVLESAPRLHGTRPSGVMVMSARGSHVQPPSPLDAYLARFLGCLARYPDGYSPVADVEQVATECELDPAFAEALFVSARARGLIEPFRAKGAKGRYRWKVSGRGTKWLAARKIASGESRGATVAAGAPGAEGAG